MSRLYIDTVQFNWYSEYIIWNSGLDEAKAGIKIAMRISITSDMQMTESKEDLKSLLMKVKEESERAGLKLSIQ